MANWQPCASLNTLRKRAGLLQKIRHFFHDADVLEVETPVLCHASVTDPFIQSIAVSLAQHEDYYLQTSPEYAMKRLLAAGSGPIFQLSKAFRREELGRFHNPEFSLLEWYRPHYDHHQLMDEVDDLLQLILKTPAAERISYHDVFLTYLNCDVHRIDNWQPLMAIAEQNNIHVSAKIEDKDTWLQLLMSHCIEPRLGKEQPCFIYDFPESQAALARIRPGNPPLASRFEVYFKGIELANGFHELLDAKEQQARFEKNNLERKKQNLPVMKIDHYLLQALQHGLPDCAGVALGIDRLIMLALDEKEIAKVMSFDITRA